VKEKTADSRDREIKFTVKIIKEVHNELDVTILLLNPMSSYTQKAAEQECTEHCHDDEDDH
jgi:hypothetical protein